MLCYLLYNVTYINGSNSIVTNKYDIHHIPSYVTNKYGIIIFHRMQLYVINKYDVIIFHRMQLYVINKYDIIIFRRMKLYVINKYDIIFRRMQFYQIHTDDIQSIHYLLQLKIIQHLLL
jgi:hypothetical protein